MYGELVYQTLCCPVGYWPYAASLYSNYVKLQTIYPHIHAPTHTFIIPTNTDVSIRFDQSLYTVDESGSVEITLILDGGIATSISVTIQPGLEPQYVFACLNVVFL